MLLANIIRRKIPFFRRLLMPTAVIAGLLGLVVKEIIQAVWGFNMFNELTLGALIYHLLPVGFIALCLRERDNYSKEFDSGRMKMERVAASKSGSIVISYYLIQGLIGIGVTVILGILFIPQLNQATGIMLALGYGQGPQQANATGLIWDLAGHMEHWGPMAARNFGLTIAAMGFLWASIPGIILVNWVARKKGITRKRDEFQKAGDFPASNIEDPDEVPLSESIDKFTLQVCMVGGVYIITIGLIYGIEQLFLLSGQKFLIDLITVFWGFAFMLAAGVALLVKAILRRLVKNGIMHRKYPNKYMMNRISGVSFDLAITAALFLVSVTTLGSLWIPIITMTTIGGIASALFIYLICPVIFKGYKDEAFLAFYGMSVGTIANGMILTREIDPDFSTPAADDLVLGSSAAIILGFPLLLLIAQAPRPGNLWWVTLFIFIYLLVLITYLLKDVIFKRKKDKKKQTAEAG
jgi:ESS family glutamate:Na+ symporter